MKVVPGSSRDRIVGWLGERLKIAVSAPPERGRANAAVVELLAGALGLPRAAVRVAAGATTPLKTLEIDLPEPELLGRLPPR